MTYKHSLLHRMEDLYCRTKMMHHVSLFMIHPCVCVWMEWGGWRVYWVFIKLKGSIVAAETRWEGLSWLLMMREISSIHHFTWHRHVSHVWQCSKWRLLTTEIGTIILYTRSSLMDKQYQVETTWLKVILMHDIANRHFLWCSTMKSDTSNKSWESIVSHFIVEHCTVYCTKISSNQESEYCHSEHCQTWFTCLIIAAFHLADNAPPHYLISGQRFPVTLPT